MAMTSIRLPSSALRKDAWIGLWGVLRGTPSHKLCASWNRCLYFSSTKFNASGYKTLFHNVFSLRLPGLLISPEYIFPFSIRLKSNISSKKSTKKTLQKVDDAEDSDEEREDRAMGEQEEELEDDPTAVRDYKDLEKVVQSFRYDIILKTGLDVGRKSMWEQLTSTFPAPRMEILWEASHCQTKWKMHSTKVNSG
ncbi:mitochondrial transcription rescue factor 1 isoform X2 [Rhinolophus sinicus]|uniref:mitochondrial transcription rescue factor 1 isoform X2 n=1 Tax=Rhinolophus sinicus TaxID=89399 RepID=UPI003D7A699D